MYWQPASHRRPAELPALAGDQPPRHPLYCEKCGVDEPLAPQRLQQSPPCATGGGANSPARALLQVAGMMTVDPAELGGAVAGLVTLQLTSLGILVAVLRFFYLRLDRRFGEVDRRFGEVRTDMDRRFAEVDRRFAEALGAMQAGFAEARDDRRRLAERLDEHGKQVARLQGIVERTYEPQRFTVGLPDKTPAATG